MPGAGPVSDQELTLVMDICNLIARVFCASGASRYGMSALAGAAVAIGAMGLAEAQEASRATEEFRLWMERDLLPRSTRPPTWKPSDIEFYQLQFEQLDGYGVDEMLRIAEREAVQLTAEMRALAKEIHPSGDLRTVWEQMKDEAPPWEGVIPMAQRYVDLTTAWLRGAGAHVAMSSTALRRSTMAITSRRCFSRKFAGLTDRVESSTGAPSEMTIRILRCSGRPSIRRCAHSSASPSMFSFRSPSFIISPRFGRVRRQGASADL